MTTTTTNPTPGSAEFLSRLLTGLNSSCPHPDKTKSRPIPPRLGFTRYSNKTLVWLDTTKLCQPCYHTAAPNGFWMYSHHRETPGPIAPPALSPSSYYPPMWVAGTENHPAAKAQNERMPASADGQEAFRLLLDSGQPFYIDLLHLTRPFDPHAPNAVVEARRVRQEIERVLAGATRVLTSAKPGTPEFDALGGRGVPLGFTAQLSSGRFPPQGNRNSQGQGPNTAPAAQAQSTQAAVWTSLGGQVRAGPGPSHSQATPSPAGPAAQQATRPPVSPPVINITNTNTNHNRSQSSGPLPSRQPNPTVGGSHQRVSSEPVFPQSPPQRKPVGFGQAAPPQARPPAAAPTSSFPPRKPPPQKHEGSSSQLGQVGGTPGRQGKQGKQGKQWKQGKQGKSGKPGKSGKQTGTREGSVSNALICSQRALPPFTV